jgi:hypothetical protein
MNLLYCDANGAVVGWHDKSGPAVPLAAYATAVRIIPYDQPISALERIGEPPITVRGDTRPYAQPVETPQLLIAYTAQVRWNVTTAGFTFQAASGPVPVACDERSRAFVGDMTQYAATLAPATQFDFVQAGVHYPLQASECATLFAAMHDLIQQARSLEAQCIADLNAATPTLATYADVDAKFSGLLAKTLWKK